jgi:drug/metabolite transporter superfamily protein YnfA
MKKYANLKAFGRVYTGTFLVYALTWLLIVAGFVGFGFMWYGVLSHLHGWVLVLGFVALAERILRVAKAHYKVNGRFWLNM